MQDTILGLIRHTLTASGGGLVAKGLLTASTLEQGIGALITLIGVIWSIINKQKSN